MSKLVFAIPSKGRLMEQTAELLLAAGLNLRKVGHARGYRGEIEGLDGIDVQYVSSSEIAHLLKHGKAHLGVTGEDLIRETVFDADKRVTFIRKLGFGHADIVVAAPVCWIDVRRMSDIEAISGSFWRTHGRRLRVATKYTNFARRFFAANGVTSYRIVESLGATEGTVAAGNADIVVDITSTGETLRANGLKILEDGLILSSEANLISSRSADWSPAMRRIESEIIGRLGR